MSTQINLSKRIAIKDEGVVKTSNVNSIDFTGAGVTATNVGNDVTVTVQSNFVVLNIAYILRIIIKYNLSFGTC